MLKKVLREVSDKIERLPGDASIEDIVVVIESYRILPQLFRASEVPEEIYRLTV